MEKYLKDIEVENRSPSEETIRRWRRAVSLDKPFEAEKKKLQIQEKMKSEGKGVKVEGSSSLYGTNEAYMETDADYPVDLNLRLGPPVDLSLGLGPPATHLQGSPLDPAIIVNSSMNTQEKMKSKGKGIQVDGSSSYGTNDAYMETRADSPVDLSLRLGPATEADNRRPFIAVKSSTTTPVIHSWLMGMNPSLASPIHVNTPRPYSYGNASNLAYEFPSSVPQLSTYCAIDISTKRAKTGGRKRKSESSPAKKYGKCTNYNCLVTQSPKWRNGPLGRNTLCNRCGIRYRNTKTREEKG